MQIVRTAIWVLVLVLVILFTLGNWDQQVTVRIWSNLVWDTRLPAVVIVSYLLGMIPMWIILRGTSWRLNRRIGHLEQATRNAAAPRPPVTTTPVTTAPPQETDPNLRSE